ncbi:MAG TPA: YhjD/YihY/BrkB family envelope integrity protein, partial [Chloroflexota bacterium]|nr:YhjD/YihY/BrkB family envelope integrity protein [Chloroflexota bacterium]
MRVGAGNISLVQTAKQVGAQISRDNVSILATALAYRFFLALFPFFIFLAALGGFIARMVGIENPADQILGLLGNMPSGLVDVVRTQLEAVLETQQPGLLSIGILGAIWASSAGMNAVVKSMNLAYDVEETRPWWKKTLLGIGMTLLAGSF